MRGNSICRGSEARAGLGGAQSQMRESCLVQRWARGRKRRWGMEEAGRLESQVQRNGEPLRVAAGECGRTGIAYTSPRMLNGEWTEWAGGEAAAVSGERWWWPAGWLWKGVRVGVRALTNDHRQETPLERSSWSWEDPLSRGWGYQSRPAGPFLFLGHWERSGPRRPGSNSGDRATSEHQGRRAGKGAGQGMGHSGVHRRQGWG